jgi:transcriptional regulator with XRE-family HTH domain
MMTDAKLIRQARAFRVARGLSLEQVAKQTSIGTAHLGKFERFLAELSIPKLQELAAYYGVSIDELVTEVREGANSHVPAPESANASQAQGAGVPGAEA